MLWQENAENKSFVVPDTVQDLSFHFHCTSGSNEIPVDHALLLQQSIVKILPWLKTEPGAAIHTIFGAATGNGWTRPEAAKGAMMQISRRTRLRLRLPKGKLNAARQLENTTMMLGGNEIHIGVSTPKPLVASTTLFCRSLTTNGVSEEEAFSNEVAGILRDNRIAVTKLLCGKAHSLQALDGQLPARSVMLADLSLEHSVLLQQQGFGLHKLLGCGIFLPHKSISAVGNSQDDA